MRKFMLVLSIAVFLVSCLPTLPDNREPLTSPSMTPPIGSPTSEEQVVSTPQSTTDPDEYAGMPIYTLSLLISEDLKTVSGQLEVYYTNNETVALPEINFWLLPNILGGALNVEDVAVNGKSVTPEYSLQNAVMRIPLKSTLEPGQSVAITITFETIIPTDPERNYGILALMDGVLALAHFYPMLAVYDENGWNISAPSPYGDIVYADAAFFNVRIDAPADLVLATSGTETVSKIDENEDGWQVITSNIGPARDFYIAGSRDYEITKKTVNGVEISVFARKDQSSRSDYVIAASSQSLEIFNERYGSYPYTKVDFVITPNFALGIEYPGIIALTDRLMTSERDFGNTSELIYLESTVVHEIAHQYFYNMVGNDQIDEPWLDESMSQFATWQYYTDISNNEENGFLDSFYSRWERVEFEPIAIGQPVAAFDGTAYGAIVYGRGAIFLIELRKQMGIETFDVFMRDYVKTYTWSIATTDKFKSLAEEHCDCDLSPLFNDWIYP